MGKRLSKIYTRTGDDGSTGLGDGQRVAKDSLRVEAFGTVDELNSSIGLVRSFAQHEQVDRCLQQVQHQLFNLGGELCIPDMELLEADRIAWLEQQLDGFNESLPPLEEFILPGGDPAAAHAHLARTICRRAERRVLSLSGQETVRPVNLQFLNRLSDLLFVIARVLARHAEQREVQWQHERRKRNSS